MDADVKLALTSLCKLYAVHGIIENLGGFIQVRIDLAYYVN